MATQGVVVLDTTKVQIFKQITTKANEPHIIASCFRYHKGTDFQANHNSSLLLYLSKPVVLDTTKVQIFKQITTPYRRTCNSSPVVLDTTKVQIFKQITTHNILSITEIGLFQIPQRYRFSSKSQLPIRDVFPAWVVLDTTKVQIFKQITTIYLIIKDKSKLFQIPQRYRFSSKSQHKIKNKKSHICCFRYHKGTDFQANHNTHSVVNSVYQLFQIPQRYRFSSKSQQLAAVGELDQCCFRYHKGTDFQANHNEFHQVNLQDQLFQIPQRYRFSSKSQLCLSFRDILISCFRYHKGTDFQANHNTQLNFKILK